tara:strand:+ start:254 stop:685 length:432 start_codon:yes stop_codon:yes gene_type:complete
MISLTTKSQQSERKQKVLLLVEAAEELCSLQLGLSDLSVSVMELKCSEPGCPPLETAFAVLEKDVDCKFKVLKELIHVSRNDVVDAIQAWVRGDTPPCGCEFTVSGAPDSKSFPPVTATTTTTDQQSQEEMERFMQQMNDGVM